jgi:hypothetical protein
VDAAQHTGISEAFDVNSFNILVVLMVGADVHVQVEALANRTYWLEATDVLGSGPWSEVGIPVTPSVSGIIELVEFGTAHPRRFYRVRMSR